MGYNSLIFSHIEVSFRQFQTVFLTDILSSIFCYFLSLDCLKLTFQ